MEYVSRDLDWLLWLAESDWRRRGQSRRNGLRTIDRLGFKVKLGTLTANRSSEGYRSGSGEARAAELMELVSDPAVEGLIATIGGFNSNSMIPFIDFAAIRHARKPLCGYSDVTSLHLAIMKFAGLRTYYGPTVMCWFGDWPDGVSESTKWFLDAVMNHDVGTREIAAPERWSNHKRDWSNGDWKTKPREWQKNFGWEVLQSGRVEAEIVAANLNTMMSAAGTKYWPDLKGKILLLEEMDAHLMVQERSLQQLSLIGVFDEITGLIISKPEIYTSGGVSFGYNDLIKNIVGKRNYPIISNFDCGHTMSIRLWLRCKSVSLSRLRSSASSYRCLAAVRRFGHGGELRGFGLWTVISKRAKLITMKSDFIILGASSWVGYYLVSNLRRLAPKSAITAVYRNTKPIFETHQIEVTATNPVQLIETAPPATVINLNRGEEGIDFDIHKNLIKIQNQKSSRYLYASSFNALDADLSRPHHEDEVPEAKSHYGRFKAQCEKELIRTCEKPLIFRFAATHGWAPNRVARTQDFLIKICRGEKIPVPRGILQNRTYVGDLAEQISLLALNEKLNGVFHLGSSDFSDEVEFLRNLAHAFGHDPLLVKEEGVLACNAVLQMERFTSAFSSYRVPTELEAVTKIVNQPELAKFKINP